MHFQTKALKNLSPQFREGNLSIAEIPFESTCFSLPTVESWEEYFEGERKAFCYASDSNPSTWELEQALAMLQGEEDCIVTSTGKSAISQTLLCLLSAGDEVLLLKEGYKSTRIFAESVLKSFGVKSRLVSVDDLQALDSMIAPNTKLFLFESPTNPLTRVIDIASVISTCKRHQVLTMFDNSLGGFHQHQRLGIDIIIHSLSKYATGLGDVMGGAILGSSSLLSQIRSRLLYFSDTLNPTAATKIRQGLLSYLIRYKTQSASALEISQYLSEHPLVTQVLYPGLETHPDHAVAKKQMNEFGGILNFNLNGSERELKLFINSLTLFRLAFGTGFVRSIVGPTRLFYARSDRDTWNGEYGVSETGVRFSIGLENSFDLIEDIDQALGRL